MDQKVIEKLNKHPELKWHHVIDDETILFKPMDPQGSTNIERPFMLLRLTDPIKVYRAYDDADDDDSQETVDSIDEAIDRLLDHCEDYADVS